MKQQLKELFEPPFRVIDYPEDSFGNLISGRRGTSFQLGMTAIEEVILRRAGCYDEWKDFIAAALNEKWERDCVEPSRWGIGETEGFVSFCECPMCDCAVHREDGYKYNYCPNCGQELLPPEDKWETQIKR